MIKNIFFLNKLRLSQRQGFTLIEMLVAVSLFSVVATITTGSILVLINNNTQNQSEQSVLGALTMAFDSMTREIRTGTYYFCNNSNFPNLGNMGVASVADCSNGGRGLAFRESTRRLTQGSQNDRIAFYFNDGTIYRKISNTLAESIIPDNIEITDFSFIVTGTDTLFDDSDTAQPMVTIIAEARERGTDNPPLVVQTTVTQRILDL